MTSCAIVTDIMWFVIVCLNYYWYYLILRGMATMMGFIKKKKKPAKD